MKTREMFMHKSRLLSSFDQSAEQLHCALMPPGTCQLEGGAAAKLGHAPSRSQSPPLPMAHLVTFLAWAQEASLWPSPPSPAHMTKQGS